MQMISIIVPVYKVENHLDKCINSILTQTYNDWELILIDDGSPDGSGAICDKYASKDTRIRVFHVENGGVSKARNLGLDNINGEWVMFVDADDWIDAECLEICYLEAIKNNLQAIQFAFCYVYQDGREKAQIKTNTAIHDGSGYINNGSFNVSVWGSLLHRSIIDEQCLRFDTNLRLAEDQVFILSYIRYCNKIQYLSKVLYYYLQNESSATHNSKSIDIIQSCNALIHLGESWLPTKRYIDTMILTFIVDMIKNADVKVNHLTYIYKKAKINFCGNVCKSVKLYYHCAKLNSFMAFWVVSVLFKVRR